MTENNLILSLAEALLRTGGMLATVESCTGGGIASRCTSIAGSSAWFERGFVTYSNASKSELVDVSPALLEKVGAVSAKTAEAMAAGGLAHSRSTICVAVTGIAGPDGGSEDKPVGTVYVGWAMADKVWNRHYVFAGNREQIRQQTIRVALSGVIAALEAEDGSSR